MEKHIERFLKILRQDAVLIEDEKKDAFGHDETEDFQFMPDVVLLPETTEQVSEILRYCNNHGISVTPSGARTGLSGGALPVKGGVVLSVARMNNIIRIDTDNQQVITQPGVITQELQEAVEVKDLFYPPDPASKGSCFIGGNIAENSGGPKAVKYGVTKDYVLNLEIVLVDGTIMWTGANVLKNSTGYDLTHLIVGSEGTLAVVTQIVLKLIPKPQHDMTMLVPFKSAEKSCQAVSAIFNAGITPSGLEFMERDAIDWTLQYMDDFTLDIPDEIQAHLLIEVDGNNMDVLMQDCEKIVEVVSQYDCGEVLLADNAAQKDKLWALRRKVGEAVKSHSIYKEEDTVVPRYYLPQLLQGVKTIGKQYGFKSVCYGHAGDGNLHVNIIKGDLTTQQWEEELPKAIREIFMLTQSLGGTISGEHGIGYVQKNYLDIVFSERQIKLMQQVKKVFDPKGILNPGKIFPDE